MDSTNISGNSNFLKLWINDAGNITYGAARPQGIEWHELSVYDLSKDKVAEIDRQFTRIIMSDNTGTVVQDIKNVINNSIKLLTDIKKLPKVNVIEDLADLLLKATGVSIKIKSGATLPSWFIPALPKSDESEVLQPEKQKQPSQLHSSIVGLVNFIRDPKHHADQQLQEIACSLAHFAENRASAADYKAIKKLPDNEVFIRWQAQSVDEAKFLKEFIADQLSQVDHRASEILKAVQEFDMSLITQDHYDSDPEQVFSRMTKPLQIELFKQFHDFYWTINSPLALCLEPTELFATSLSEWKELLESERKLGQIESAKLDKLITLDALFRFLTGPGVYRCTISTPLGEALEIHKQDFLKNQMQNKQARRVAKGEQGKVLIAGMGPAGTTRAMLAALQGYDVAIIDKQEEKKLFQIENIVKINMSPIFNFLGVTQMVVEDTSCHIDLSNDYEMQIQLGHLQRILHDRAKHLIPEDSFVYGAQIVSVSDPIEGNGQQGTQCKIQMSEGREFLIAPKLLVDTTGAGRHVARLVGELRVEDRKVIMLAAAVFPLSLNLESSQERVSLKTLRNSYQLVSFLPAEQSTAAANIQEELRQLTKNLSSATGEVGHGPQDRIAELKQLEKELIVGRVASLASVLQSDLEKQVKWAAVFRVAVGHGENVAVPIGSLTMLTGGDAAGTTDPRTGLGANTGIESAAHFGKMLENSSALDMYTLAMDRSIDHVVSVSGGWSEMYELPHALQQAKMDFVITHDQTIQVHQILKKRGNSSALSSDEQQILQDIRKVVRTAIDTAGIAINRPALKALHNEIGMALGEPVVNW